MIHGNGGHAKVIRDIQVRPESAWIIAVGDNRLRKKEAKYHAALGHYFGVAIHPSAVVSPSAKIGEGTVIMAGAVVQADAVIGKHCIINTCASVDHDCVLENFVHIAPGAHLCGGVKVGEGSLIGAAVGIAPGMQIGRWQLVRVKRIEMQGAPIG